MMRKILLILAVCLAAALAGLYWYTRPLPVLTVTTWPGPYGRAQAAALMRPYAAQNRVDVHLAEWDGNLDELRQAVKTGAYKGDVIDFELPKAEQACHEGLLEPVDAASLPPGLDGTPAAQDFVAGAIGPCWVGSVLYSQLLLYRPGAFPAAAGARGFFDPSIPGGRGLKQGAKFNLELALLADGVPPAQVYPLLSTEAGLARAFARLSAIRAMIVWWNAPGEPASLLQSGQAVITTALNGDLPDAQKKAGVQALRDDQLYELDVFGVPKGNPRKDRAMDFIRSATGSRPLAGVADWVPYSPARRSALPLVGRNPETGVAMTPLLPVRAQDLATAFAIDEAWWRTNGPRVESRWQQWLSQPH